MNFNVDNILHRDTSAPRGAPAPAADFNYLQPHQPVPAGFRPPIFYPPWYHQQPASPVLPSNAVPYGVPPAAVPPQIFPPAHSASGHYVWVPDSTNAPPSTPSNTSSDVPSNTPINDTLLYFTPEQVMALMRQRGFPNFRGGRGRRGRPYRRNRRNYYD